MRVLALAVLFAIVAAQKGNVTAKKPKEPPRVPQIVVPKPSPKNMTEPAPKGTPEPKGTVAPSEEPEPAPLSEPLGNILAALRPAWEACQLAYPNPLQLAAEDRENFLIQPYFMDLDFTRTNAGGATGPEGEVFDHRRVHFKQTLVWPNILCQLGYRLRAENPKAKCSELCVTGGTVPVQAWTTYTLSAGASTFYYPGGGKYTYDFSLGLLAGNFSWSVAQATTWAERSDIGLNLEDPAILGTCMIGCQLAADAKPAPAAPVEGKKAGGPQIGAGVAAGAGGIIVLGGIGFVVSRRLRRNPKKPQQQKGVDATIAI